jgi:hypothetical protein
MKQLSDDYVGTQLSHATMRPEDLIPTFVEFLKSVELSCDIEKEVRYIQAEVDTLELREVQGYGTYYVKPEDANWLLNEDIWDLLNDIAPRFTAFGSHEGDGSAYGFWTDNESLIEHLQDILYVLSDILDGGNADFEDAKLVLRNINKLFESHNV